MTEGPEKAHLFIWTMWGVMALLAAWQRLEWRSEAVRMAYAVTLGLITAMLLVWEITMRAQR